MPGEYEETLEKRTEKMNKAEKSRKNAGKAENQQSIALNNCAEMWELSAKYFRFDGEIKTLRFVSSRGIGAANDGSPSARFVSIAH